MSWVKPTSERVPGYPKYRDTLYFLAEVVVILGLLFLLLWVMSRTGFVPH